MSIMRDGLVQAIRKLASSATLPDGTAVKVLTIAQVENLAADFRLSERMVEIEALENDIVPKRYLRNLKTFSFSDQARLLGAKVAVIGLGGLGGTVAEILARLGTGRLVLVDGDIFEEHNLNRQLLSRRSNLGQSKAKEAARRVKEVNPAVEVVIWEKFFKPGSAQALLDGVAAVVDCLDAIDTRFLLEEAARKMNLPLISAAVAGFSGHVTTVFPADQGLRLIYGPPEHLQATRGAETGLGCLAPAVSMLGCLEAMEVCKVILGKAENLRNKLLLVDLNDYLFQVLDLV